MFTRRQIESERCISGMTREFWMANNSHTKRKKRKRQWHCCGPSSKYYRVNGRTHLRKACVVCPVLLLGIYTGTHVSLFVFSSLPPKSACAFADIPPIFKPKLHAYISSASTPKVSSSITLSSHSLPYHRSSTSPSLMHPPSQTATLPLVPLFSVSRPDMSTCTSFSTMMPCISRSGIGCDPPMQLVRWPTPSQRVSWGVTPLSSCASVMFCIESESVAPPPLDGRLRRWKTLLLFDDRSFVAVPLDCFECWLFKRCVPRR